MPANTRCLPPPTKATTSGCPPTAQAAANRKTTPSKIHIQKPPSGKHDRKRQKTNPEKARRQMNRFCPCPFAGPYNKRLPQLPAAPQAAKQIYTRFPAPSNYRQKNTPRPPKTKPRPLCRTEARPNMAKADEKEMKTLS